MTGLIEILTVVAEMWKNQRDKLEESETEIAEYLKHGQLDIVQAKYSILDRKAEEELFPICKENDIVFQAYSPLEQGLLTGKLTKEYTPIGAQSNKKWFQSINMGKAIDMVDKWSPLCDKYDCTVPNLALAWILAQGKFINILSGVSSKEKLKDNVKSTEIQLSSEDERWMHQLAQSIDVD